MNNKFKTEKVQLCFDDVLLVQQQSDITTRKDIDLTPKPILDFNLKLPYIASPMNTVSEHDMANKIGELGALAVVHRYNSIEEQVETCKKIKNVPYGAAVGVLDTLERAKELYKKAGCRLFCVDVAHGYNVNVAQAVKALSDWSKGKNIHIMAGNIATKEGFTYLSDVGADSIRSGIGPGSICETQVQTGHGMPQLASLLDIDQVIKRDAKAQLDLFDRTLLIADGGIKNSGDVAKALAAGADYVMMGSMFAGTDEAPGLFIKTLDGRLVKPYNGMASKESQIQWKGTFSSLEGIASYATRKGSVSDVIDELNRGLKSALSYSGAHTLKEFYNKSQFIIRTQSGIVEGTGHHGKNASR